jgi:hypothetical protein
VLDVSDGRPLRSLARNGGESAASTIEAGASACSILANADRPFGRPNLATPDADLKLLFSRTEVQPDDDVRLCEPSAGLCGFA